MGVRRNVGGVLTELLAHDGVAEHCELDGRIGFLALHGGLEAGTYELAREAARRTGASLYAVVQPADLRWHLPSNRYALEQSEALSDFCAHVEVGVSLHGYGGLRGTDHRWFTILVGGGSRRHATELGRGLREELHEYTIVDDLARIPRAYRGVHADNPVNRVRGGGVQLELPPRVRGQSPIWDDHDFDAEPFVPHSEALLGALVRFAGVAAGASRRST